MAQINKPNQYFNTVLYTGDSTSNRSITGVNFQPDWVWIKNRTDTYAHMIYDNIRGAGNFIESNSTNAETSGSHMNSFDSDGFTISYASSNRVNVSGSTYASWNWLASNTTASNTDGSITSTVSTSTTSGFSIVSYTGTGATATIGHGLGVTPEIIIVKKRDTAGTDWITWGSILGGTVGSEFIKINFTGAKTTGLNSSWFNNTAPTSSVFTVGTQSDLNGSSATYIAYCFAEKKGFSKFGKFTSNGSDDGTFTYCGFKPAWIMMKANVSDTWSHWFIFDNKRDTYNLADLPQYANLAIQDGYYGGTPATNYSQIDMLSNGFKIRRDGNWGLGGNGTEVFYMAFAEQPLVGTNDIPTTAR